jgi:hypothetical protein
MRTKTTQKEKLTQNFQVSTSNVTTIAPAVSVLFLTLLKKKGGET